MWRYIFFLDNKYFLIIYFKQYKYDPLYFKYIYRNTRVDEIYIKSFLIVEDNIPIKKLLISLNRKQYNYIT